MIISEMDILHDNQYIKLTEEETIATLMYYQELIRLLLIYMIQLL